MHKTVGIIHKFPSSWLRFGDLLAKGFVAKIVRGSQKERERKSGRGRWRRVGKGADKVQVQLPIRSFKFSVCAAETFSLQFLIYTQRQQSVKERREADRGWRVGRGSGEEDCK